MVVLCAPSSGWLAHVCLRSVTSPRHSHTLPRAPATDVPPSDDKTGASAQNASSDEQGSGVDTSGSGDGAAQGGAPTPTAPTAHGTDPALVVGSLAWGGASGVTGTPMAQLRRMVR